MYDPYIFAFKKREIRQGKGLLSNTLQVFSSFCAESCIMCEHHSCTTMTHYQCWSFVHLCHWEHFSTEKISPEELNKSFLSHIPKHNYRKLKPHFDLGKQEQRAEIISRYLYWIVPRIFGLKVKGEVSYLPVFGAKCAVWKENTFCVSWVINYMVPGTDFWIKRQLISLKALLDVKVQLINIAWICRASLMLHDK